MAQLHLYADHAARAPRDEDCVFRRPDSLLFVTFVVLLLSLSGPAKAFAVTATEIIPASAPVGADAIVVGSALDTQGLTVTFPSSTGGVISASISSRTPSRLDLTVPTGAVSGTVKVLNSTITVATFQFTVATAPSFSSVGAISASQPDFGNLKTPYGISISPTTSITYLADTGHQQVRSVTPSGVVTVIAGSGAPGFVNGTGAAALFKDLKGIALDEAHGCLYVADTSNNVIRKVTLAGVVTTLAGSGKRADATGTGAAAAFSLPVGIAVDSAGNVYVADTGNHRIKKITPGGVVTNVIGTGRAGFVNGTSTAQLNAPEALLVRPDGTIYVADTGNHAIRKIANGVLSTVAGTGVSGFVDGPIAASKFFSPKGIDADPSGNLYVADAGNSRIRRIDFAASTVTTIAGSGVAGNVDGDPAAAQFRNPAGVSFAGAVYVSDTNNNALRSIYPETRFTDCYPRTTALAGGDVTVFGTGFSVGLTRFLFGGVDATNVRILNGSRAVVTVPVSSIPKSVRVDVYNGTANGGRSAAFTYAGTPSISKIAPASGPLSGGTAVQITGAQFTADTQVLWGNQTLMPASVASSSLSVTTPAGSAGSVNVGVRTVGGEYTAPNAFTYVAPPTISSVSPLKGSTGLSVTITGSNFDPSSPSNAVSFNGVPAVISAITSTTIQTSVPAGAQSGPVSVTSAGGSATSPTPFTVVSVVGVQIAPASLALKVGQQSQMTLTATYSDGTTATVPAGVQWTSSRSWFVGVLSSGVVSGVAPGSAVITASYSGYSADAAVSVADDVSVPADPAASASPIDPTKPTRFADSIAFLYQGANPLQRNVTVGALNVARVCVIRGTVHDTANAALPGVRVSVLGAPEVGYTVTRADGAFDIVVNGGATAVLSFEKTDYISAQRKVVTAWHESRSVGDLVMARYDSKVSVIDLASGATGVAEGTPTTDDSGYRKAVLVFSPGTTANMTLPDGSTQTLGQLHVRATEQTVGKLGAMPADLPNESAYTYCVELSVDEAVAAGAKSVVFSKPVGVYVENFLGFAAGTVVPSGYYDRALAQWIASENGRVIKIIDKTANGSAIVDLTGDGIADDAIAAGFAAEELVTLGQKYSTGVSLWRVPVTHFTPFDFNWPWSWAAPLDARYPGVRQALGDDPISCPTCHRGSIIEAETMNLGESVHLAGTPFSLEYRSRDTDGYTSQREVDVELSNDALPTSLKRIDLKLDVAGKSFTSSFSPAPNQKTTFTWDGTDVYGRHVVSDASLRVHISYVYDAVYTSPADVARAFGLVSTNSTTIPSRREQAISQDYDVLLRGRRPTQGLGGWYVDGIHSYDVENRLLRLGTGTDVRLDESGAEGQRVNTSGYVYSVRTGSDGSLYSFFPDPSLSTITRIWPDGHSQVIAGGGSAAPVDGLSATAAQLDIRDVAPLPNGDVVFFDEKVQKIFRITSNAIPQNRLSLVAVGSAITSLTAGPDGSVYFTDNGSLFRVDGSGSVVVVSSRNIQTEYKAVRAGADGKLYVRIAEASPNGSVWDHLYRWEPSNKLELRVFQTCFGDYVADKQGRVFFNVTESTCSIRGVNVIETDGRTHKLVSLSDTSFVNSMAVTPDGSLAYVTTCGSAMCIQVAGTRVRFTSATVSDIDGYTVASPSEQDAFKFSPSGKLLETRNARLGTLRYKVAYDDAGFPVTLEDVHGRVTTILRDANHVATAIVAPTGDRTDLVVGADGMLQSVSSARAGTRTFTYYVNGLLKTYTNPKGDVSNYSYDDRGRLARDTDADGGYKQLNRTLGSDGTESIDLTTAAGRHWQYTVKKTDVSTNDRSATDPVGLISRTSTSPTTTATVLPNGMRVRTDRQLDPQWKSMSPLPATSTLTFPSGKSVTLNTSRSVTLSDPLDPLSVVTATEVRTFNGKATTIAYTASDRKVKFTSPLGRVIQMTLDDKGEIATLNAPGELPVTYGYDEKGRLTSITQGTRNTTYTWNDYDQRIQVKDSLNTLSTFGFNNGNVTSATFPGLTTIQFGSDDNRVRTSVGLTGRASHSLSLSASGAVSSYSLFSPAAASTRTTSFSRDVDHFLNTITRSGGAVVTLVWDRGRLSRIEAPSRTISNTFDSSGTIASITDSVSGAITSYDWDGLLPKSETWSGPVAGTVAWSFDNDLRLQTETVNGVGVTYGYDNDALLTSAGPLTYTRDAASGRLNSSVVGVVSDSYAYDDFGALNGYTSRLNNSDWYSFVLVRDDSGRISSTTETVNGATVTRAYFYDPSGRLTKVNVNGALSEEYLYDSAGNRTYAHVGGSSFDATYSDADEIRTYGDETYEVGSEGEIKSRSWPGARIDYTFDALGELKTVTRNGRVVEYVLDGRHRRIGKKVDGVMVATWLYSGQIRIIAETKNGVTTQFVYGTRGNAPEYMVRNGITYRFLCDAIGSPRFIVDSQTGAIAQALEYDSFGNIVSDTAPGFQPFAFAGGLYDADSGLLHFGARDYDAHTGRWVSRDPLGFGAGDVNLYAYVFSDPLNHVDPSGRWTGVDEVGGAAIGGVISAGSYLVGELIKYHGSTRCISKADLGVAFGSGFIAGFFATDTLGASIVVGAGSNGLQYLGIQAVHHRGWSGNDLTNNLIGGAIGGMLGFALKGAEAADDVARGPLRWANHKTNIDQAFDNAPREFISSYAGNADPDCGCD